MARPPISRAERRNRAKKILDYLQNNQFSSAEGIYQEHGIGKSEVSSQILANLVRRGKVHVFHTEEGNARYYIDHEWSPDLERKRNQRGLLYWHCQEIRFQLNGFKIKHIKFAEILNEFIKLVDLRYKIFKFEMKNHYNPSIVFLDDDVIHLILFLSRNGIKLRLPFWYNQTYGRSEFISRTPKEFLDYINTHIKFARGLLNHRAHAYTKMDYNLKKGRNKRTKYPRSLKELLEMRLSDDNIEWRLRQRYFKKAIEKIGKGKITSYKKCMERLGAENESPHTSNSVYQVSPLLFNRISKDLGGVKKSRNRERYWLILSRWWDVILENAARTMVNKLIGNEKMTIRRGIKIGTQKSKYRFVNDFTNMSEEELRIAKVTMDWALLGESIPKEKQIKYD